MIDFSYEQDYNVLHFFFFSFVMCIANASPLSVSPPSIFTQQQREQREQLQQQQQQQQHQHQHQQQQQQYHLKSSSEHSSSVLKPVSTYRTEAKEKESSIVSNGKSADFKIPSGKEGSLKHRILTRPYGEKESTAKQTQKQSLPTHSQNTIVTKYVITYPLPFKIQFLINTDSCRFVNPQKKLFDMC